MHDLGASGSWVGLSYVASFVGTCLMFAGILAHAAWAIPLGLVAWASAAPIGFRLNWSPGQRAANRFVEAPPVATSQPYPVPSWTKARDLGAELSAARKDLDRAKRALER
jgi:hypothetical protein